METDAASLPIQAPESGEEEPKLGFGTKFVKIFFDPRAVFRSVGRNHEWVILWILTSLVAIGGYMPVKEIVKNSQLAQIEERLDQANVPEDQREPIRERVRGQFENPLFLLFVPGGMLVAMVIVAGILLFLANIILGGSTSYLKMLNAYAWTMMVVIPGTIVTIPLVMAKGSMDVSLGLGVLTSPETGAFLKKFLSSFEIFALWQVWLSSLAVAVLAETDAGKAFWAVLSAWIVWVFIQSGLAAIGIQMGGL